MTVPLFGLAHCSLIFPPSDAPAKPTPILAQLPFGALQPLVVLAFGPAQITREVVLGPTQGLAHPSVRQRRATPRFVDHHPMIRSHHDSHLNGRQANRGVDQDGLPLDRGNLSGEKKRDTLGGYDDSVHGSLR